MTRPPRLLDSSSNDALRALLSSGLDDAPDAEALPKVAAALGLTAVTMAASSLAATSVAAQAVSVKAAALAGSAPAAVAGSTALGAGSAASAGAAGFWGAGTALALGKTLLVSMVSAGTLSIGAVAVYEHTNPTAPSAAVVERAGGVPSGSDPRSPYARAEQARTGGMPAPAPAPIDPATASEGSNLLAPRAPADARSQRGSTVLQSSSHPEARPAFVNAPPTDADAALQRADAAPQRAGVLAREVRQIDSVRQALESRDADSALAALDGYERSRVVGVLDREALLLKIEALSQKQDLEQAKALARQYLQRFPTDVHAPRLRALLGAARGMGTTSSSVQAFPDE